MEGGLPAYWTGPVRSFWQPGTLPAEVGQPGWTGLYHAGHGVQGVAGVSYHHPQTDHFEHVVHHHHRPVLLQAAKPSWIYRPLSALQFPSAAPSVDALQYLVTKIEVEHPSRVQEETWSQDLKKRTQLAATYLDQLKEIGKSLASEDGSEGLRFAQAESSALKVSITKLLEPLDRLRRGEGNPAENTAWEGYKNRQRKIKHYRARRKKRRQHVARTLREGREAAETVDGAADAWRAQRLAEDIAKKRFLEMEEAASLEACKKRRQVEQDIDALLLLERLQKLRTLRVARLRKQGHVFPEEDSNFMARIQQSAEQEAAEARAGLGSPSSIVTTAPPPLSLEDDEESVYIAGPTGPAQGAGPEGLYNQNETQEDPFDTDEADRREAELQHYYNGSANNMGRLIEVRRAWDTLLSPDGSATPGHWVLPPAPSGPLWAQYLQKPEL